MNIEFDMLQTIAIATVVLLVGGVIRNQSSYLTKYTIPNPVIGGVFFSLLSLVGYSTGAFFFEFDTTLQDVFMTVFFTAVGFSSNLKAFGRAGKIGLQLIAVIILIIIIENILGVTLASIFNLDPLIGLSTGSAALIGGHGTSAAFGPIFEDLGATSASTVALASATFGLVIGGVVGGPIGHYLMKKHKLSHHSNEKMT